MRFESPAGVPEAAAHVPLPDSAVSRLQLERRCLSAIVEVQRRLLALEPWADLYGGLLEPLGRATDASRVYMFEARRDAERRLRVQQRAEWCAPGIRPELDNPDIVDFPLEAILGPEAIARIEAGEPFQERVSGLPQPMRAMLERQDIQAILILPVRVRGEFFGFIGFDDCVAPRRWEALEVDVLTGAAEALALALEHRQADARRARTEAALRRTEAGFHLLLEGFPDPVLVHAEGVLLSVNPAAVRYLGHPGPDDLLGQPVLSLLRSEEHEALKWHFGEARGGLAARTPEVVVRRRDGQERVAELVTLAVLFDGRPALVTVARDFTERKRLQAQLMLGDRMASMGTLAAGIAHELNNPLAYVLANLEYVASSLAPREEPYAADELAEWRQVLSEAREGAERMRQLVRQLKAFSRVEEESTERMTLHPLLDAVARMAANQVRPRARLVKDYGQPPEVLGNEGKLFQVFLNLLINAAQSIPEGPREAHEVRLVTRSDARGWAVVEVRDTGGGIRPEHLPRIFEPFFTTKPAGVGTGLGLSICHSIVCALGGTISAESQPGQGTTFRVALPPAAV
ncbi:ATP-binding protein [Myxococcaceae bacterium GXIMD 01537]